MNAAVPSVAPCTAPLLCCPEAKLHYDTSLRYATFGGVDQPSAITEWRELTDPAEKAVLP